MILSEEDARLVRAVSGSNITRSVKTDGLGGSEASGSPHTHDAPADPFRTFENISPDRLDAILDEYADTVKNSNVTRLPTLEEVQQFLTAYPFFRVGGFLHNLNVSDPVELYITGIEYIPDDGDGGDPLSHISPSDQNELKRQFAHKFHTADHFTISPYEFTAHYHLDRNLELEG